VLFVKFSSVLSQCCVNFSAQNPSGNLVVKVPDEFKWGNICPFKISREPENISKSCTIWAVSAFLVSSEAGFCGSMLAIALSSVNFFFLSILPSLLKILMIVFAVEYLILSCCEAYRQRLGVQ